MTYLDGLVSVGVHLLWVEPLGWGIGRFLEADLRKRSSSESEYKTYNFSSSITYRSFQTRESINIAFTSYSQFNILTFAPHNAVINLAWTTLAFHSISGFCSVLHYYSIWQYSRIYDYSIPIKKSLRDRQRKRERSLISRGIRGMYPIRGGTSGHSPPNAEADGRSKAHH